MFLILVGQGRNTTNHDHRHIPINLAAILEFASNQEEAFALRRWNGYARMSEDQLTLPLPLHRAAILLFKKIAIYFETLDEVYGMWMDWSSGVILAEAKSSKAGSLSPPK